MTNEQRAEELMRTYGFDFQTILKDEIIRLIETEIDDFQPGSSEYIRLLCGYLYCIGDKSDAELIRRAKCEINFDVGCMIDTEWIDSLADNQDADYDVRPREKRIADFIHYYENFKADDDWGW